MRINLKAATVLLMAFISQSLFASPQMPDYIIYKNDTTATYNLLVEKYLQQNEIKTTDKLFGLSFRDGSSFNCWRGYQAIYKIENDSLFLVDIINCGDLKNSKKDRSVSQGKIRSIFGARVKNERVYIDWFSGDISFRLNNTLLRWDGVFYRIFENEKVIEINKGRITNVKDVNNYVDNPKGINRRYQEKISDIMFKNLEKIKWKNAKECHCSEKYIITINKEGKVSKAAMQGYDTDEKIDEYWERAEYNYCIKSVYTALKKLKFDVIKDKGNPISEDIFVEIWVTDKGKTENLTN